MVMKLLLRLQVTVWELIMIMIITHQRAVVADMETDIIHQHQEMICILPRGMQLMNTKMILCHTLLTITTKHQNIQRNHRAAHGNRTRRQRHRAQARATATPRIHDLPSKNPYKKKKKKNT